MEKLKDLDFPKDEAEAAQRLLDGLTGGEREVFDSFCERVKADLLPNLGDEAEHLKLWLNTPCYVRYLKAREWDADAAFKMLSKSVEWRNEYKPHKIPKTEIQPILDLGSLYRNGTDKFGRPVLYIKPAVFNPHPWELRVRGLVYILEHTINSMRPGVEKMVWIIDFSGYANRTQRSEGGMKVAQNSLNILQNEFPERLGEAFILNSPWWLSFLWTFLSPFMSSATKAKIKWVSGDKNKIHEQLSQSIADEELETDYGGTRAMGAAAADPTPTIERKSSGKDKSKESAPKKSKSKSRSKREKSETSDAADASSEKASS